MPLKSDQKLELNNLSDAEILKMRFKNISSLISESEVKTHIEQLYAELEIKGLVFRPKIFFGDEWFSPEGMNAIAVPFYLASNRLKSLEKSQMLEVEGGDPEWFMRLIRHEAGHCFDHCYRFSKRKKWQQIFGSPNEDYAPETYRPQPYSKSYVHHLDNWYAQAHPDEDFAETFAVWLDPNSDWKKEYAKWPVALRKLEYIDQIAKESIKLNILAVGGRVPSNISQLSTTLEKYYQKRRREQEDEYPDFYDADLKKIFNGDTKLSKREHAAARFMKKHRKEIISTLVWSTNERKYSIDKLVKRLTERCDQLDLKLGKPSIQTTIEVSSFLTSLVKNYLFTGKFKRKV